MKSILEISNISKAFGSSRVINNLSLSVPEHTIYGFIGQNGAGKTTTMKMVLGLYTVDSGRITVNGEQVRYGNNTTNRYIGYLPDVPEFYDYMTPSEYLKLCGEITGMSRSDIKNRSEELLHLVGLEKNNKRIKGFSRGMKQRLGIAQALLNRPKLLICDEPTSALDPIGRKELLDILQNVKNQTTVIFSTHILSDVERICDEIGLIKDGRLALSGTIEEIHSLHHSNGFDIEFSENEEAGIFMSIMPGGELTGKNVVSYKNGDKKEMSRAMKLMVENNIVPVRVEMGEPTLESLFLETVQK